MDYFYSSSIRRLLVAFMTTFSNVRVRRYDDTHEKTPDHYREIVVPIKFGNFQKEFARRTEDESGQRYYIQCPCMAVTFSSFSYSESRSVSSKRRRYFVRPEDMDKTPPEDLLTDMMPTPWDITFALSIHTDSFQDFCQIVEQIAPWFNPSIYLEVKEFDTINLKRDIRVTLEGLDTDITEPIAENEKRYVNGTMTFKADAWMYKPLSDSGLITKIHSHYGFDPYFNLPGENFYTEGMELKDAEDKELHPVTPSSTRGELPEEYSANTNETMVPLGWVKEQTADGKPDHVPQNTKVRVKKNPKVSVKAKKPTPKTEG